MFARGLRVKCTCNKLYYIKMTKARPTWESFWNVFCALWVFSLSSKEKSKWPLQINVCFCLLSYSRCVVPVLVHSDCLPRKSEGRVDSAGLISRDSPSTLTLTHCSKFCPNTSRCKPSEDHPLDETSPPQPLNYFWLRANWFSVPSEFM